MKYGKICRKNHEIWHNTANLPFKKEASTTIYCGLQKNQDKYAILSEKILQKNVYLFIERATNSFSSKTLISETSINSISEIIKDVTKRYCTFHSLRHSYITYQLINILNSENSNPYLILDLCIKAGHSTPAISLSSYAHYYFIRLYNRKDTVQQNSV